MGGPPFILPRGGYEAGSLAVTGAALAEAAAFAPAVQVQAFEPAFYTSCPTWSVIPYSPSTVSVMMPTYTPGVAAAPVLAETLTVPPNTTVAPEFVATSCGPCGRPYSQLPPNGFYAWQKLLQETNRPYDSLINGGYGIRRTF